MSFSATFVAMWYKSRRSPDTYIEFIQKRYYDGPVKIISCNRHPSLVNTIVNYKGELGTVVNYMSQTCKIRLNGKTYRPDPVHPRFTFQIATDCEGKFSLGHIAFMYQEMLPHTSLSIKAYMEKYVFPGLKDSLYTADVYKNVDIKEFCETEFYETIVKKHCALARATLEETALWYFGRSGNLWILTERLQNIRELSFQDLKKAVTWLSRIPWKFCFYNYCKEFNVKELSIAQYNRSKKEFGIRDDPLINAAVCLYDFVKYKRLSGDTIFNLSEIKNKFQNKYPVYNRITEDALKFLITHKAITYIERDDMRDPTHICTPRDEYAANKIIEFLEQLNTKTKKNPQVALRNLKLTLPCKPQFELTMEQQKAVTHMYQNPLTLLEGGGGCGKSECGIVWAAMQFKKALVVSITGTAVDMISSRLGKHPGAVHTIAYVATCAKHVPFTKKWLEEYDTLIVDEASNVDTQTLATLVGALPNIQRAILVGDGGQINPISPGVPFRNLISMYPQHTFRLTKCLRVDPDSLSLAEASMKIRSGKAREIKFETNKGPIQLWQRPSNVSGVKSGQESKVKNQLAQKNMQVYFEKHIDTIIQSKSDVMNTQFISMLHADRKNLNIALEEAVVKKKIIDRPRKPIILYGSAAGRPLNIFPGQKLTFTQNRPATQTPKICDGVKNGEVIQVKKVQRKGYGKELDIHTMCGKTIRVSDVVKANHGGVLKSEVDAAWVITCNKSQGSEWNKSIFWIHENPAAWMWTREFPYVAISRAKKQSIVIGKRSEFNNMCSKTTRTRNTLLNHKLKRDRSISQLNGNESETPDLDFKRLKVARKPMTKYFPQRDEIIKKYATETKNIKSLSL
jgi:hypothetical protein